MGDFKDFDLDLKKVKNNRHSGEVSPNYNTWDVSAIICIPITEVILSIPDCPPNPSYGGNRGCGPGTSANSRVVDE
ncbi:hypothetical protein [Tissierella pigra]|uniref:Uncharacterized protein n=1 Tax=Tissierella pigra TaxID=2607614 RepID=A0A6N7XHM1_9FIRM|nr:hypothetical protein [Tissierella pigra]MSU01551.1 hypothetical protein [Tissierella pigra]